MEETLQSCLGGVKLTSIILEIGGMIDIYIYIYIIYLQNPTRTFSKFQCKCSEMNEDVRLRQ